MTAIPSLSLPETFLEKGGINSLVGTLTSRTLMLAELEAMLSAAGTDAPQNDIECYRDLVVEENVCGKNSQSTRQKTFRHLRELYALEEEVPLFPVWRTLWAVAANERPLLALLLASAREPLLRATAPVVLQTLPGASVTSQDFEQAIESAFPGHYRQDTLARTGRNCASAWSQSGHLAGRAAKRRAKVVTGPATTTFALILGHCAGTYGLGLFHTFWTELLDVGDAQLDQYAFAAGSRGWIDYRRIGDVAHIGFSNWPSVRNGQ